MSSRAGQGPGLRLADADPVRGGDAEVSSYVCPMHPEVTASEPAACPKCGMKLIPAAGAVSDEADGGAHAHGHGHDHDMADGPEWEDLMPEINRQTNNDNMVCQLVDRETNAENADITWAFRVGDRVKIRLANEMDQDSSESGPAPMEAASEAGNTASEQASTFVFADLAGYAAVTEAHGDEHAADLAAHFFAHARELLAECDGEEVKVIGDEMMARINDPAAAIRFALDLSHHSIRRHEHLDVQVGLHYGPALQRGDDWFGATVNVAARVTSLAEPGEVLTTAETARAAGEIEGVSYRSRGETKLKHVRQPMTLLTVLCDVDNADLERDPVCHMLLDPSRATEQVSYAGADFWFCSPECRAAFASEPDDYL